MRGMTSRFLTGRGSDTLARALRHTELPASQPVLHAAWKL
jgi:hypothetical protein